MTVPPLLPLGGNPRYRPVLLSEGIAAVLIAMYALTLLFSLRTHKTEIRAAEGVAGPQLWTPVVTSGRARSAVKGPLLDLGKLLLSAAATAFASELLIDSLNGTLTALDLPETFVGVVIVAIVGNAAEHSTALLFAYRGEMDVALGIAWESSKQIALLVAPARVFIGLLVGTPMDLAFTRFEVIALGLAVIALALIALDGETNWLEGAFLLAVYAVLGMGFFFIG